MSFAQLAPRHPSAELLQRSLERGRLAHGYLFSGESIRELEGVSLALAKTLNCQEPLRRGDSLAAVDSCGRCRTCRRIDSFEHPDVHWVRPESKSRIISIDQMRGLMQTVNLKPAEAQYKVAVIVAADRLNAPAANAFLKTLEEPPSRCVLILLSTEPQRVLETLVSRCQRLAFGGSAGVHSAEDAAWLEEWSRTAAAGADGLLGRYRLLGSLLGRLAQLREAIEGECSARSPLAQYDELEPQLREKWEEELSAAVEAEYRRQRADLLLGLERWFRDVWLQTIGQVDELAGYPELLPRARSVAGRLNPAEALANLQTLEETLRLLNTNVQEALALEVSFLKLRF